MLSQRATKLGTNNKTDRAKFTKTSTKNMNKALFQESVFKTLQEIPNSDDNDSLVIALSEQIQTCTIQCSQRQRHTVHQIPISAAKRWDILWTENNHQKLWKAIQWSGKVQPRSHDEEFVRHYAYLLNDYPKQPLRIPTNQIVIPILDSPIHPTETLGAIRSLKKNKAAGHDGLLLDTVKDIPEEATIHLTAVFNQIFFSSYPDSWNKHNNKHTQVRRSHAS